MINRIYFTLMSALLLFFPSSVMAHNAEPGSDLIDFLLHPFTGGDHLLMMALGAVSVAVYYISRRRYPDR